MKGELTMMLQRLLVLGSAWVAAAAAPAFGQFATGFEAADAIGASPEGTDLNGQEAWYNPIPDFSVSWLAYTYADNALGLPENPGGSAQFVAGTGPGEDLYARSQRPIELGDATGAWSICFDVAAVFVGDGPTFDNAGSVSTRIIDDATDVAGVIALARWTDPTFPVNWNADMLWYDGAGAAITESVPDPAFQGLETSHWYRWCLTVDLDSNRVLEVSIQDLTTMATASYAPPDRYMIGGDAPAMIPSALRLFAGAIISGNTLAVDNVGVAPAAPPCFADCDGNGTLNILDFVCYQGLFQAGDPGADCDGNGALNILDFVCFQGEFQQGCP